MSTWWTFCLILWIACWEMMFDSVYLVRYERTIHLDIFSDAKQCFKDWLVQLFWKLRQELTEPPRPEALSMSSFPSAPDRWVACSCGGYICIHSIIMKFPNKAHKVNKVLISMHFVYIDPNVVHVFQYGNSTRTFSTLYVCRQYNLLFHLF